MYKHQSQYIKTLIKTTYDKQFTLECNPDSIDNSALSKNNVNKLQSLKQKCSLYCTEKVDEIY